MFLTRGAPLARRLEDKGPEERRVPVLEETAVAPRGERVRAVRSSGTGRVGEQRALLEGRGCAVCGDGDEAVAVIALRLNAGAFSGVRDAGACGGQVARCGGIRVRTGVSDGQSADGRGEGCERDGRPCRGIEVRKRFTWH